MLIRGLGCLVIVFGGLLAGPVWGQTRLPTDWQAAQYTGAMSFEMDSKFTGQRYQILVGLPTAAPPASGYPVLWALDGLASFSMMEVARPRHAVSAESTAWRERRAPASDGLIVAIGYASGMPFDVNARAKDYTPQVDGPSGDSFSTEHGGSQAFLLFLTLELRPLIAQQFPLDARRHTLFGFSYGGLFAADTLTSAPKHFQRYWIASPSLWFGNHHVMRNLDGRLSQWKSPMANTQVVLTVGQDEQFPLAFDSAAHQDRLSTRAMVDNNTRLKTQLDRLGKDKVSVIQMVVPGHDHLDMLAHGARRVLGFAFAP